MAGDWIKADHTLPDKREVIAMARALGVDRDMIAGKWIRVWSWASDNTENGNAPSVTEKDIDDTARMAGFAKAAADVGWLVFDDGGVTFPNFDRHNSKSAKTRALGAARLREHRSGETKMKRSERYNVVTREEKRREEEEYTHTPREAVSVETASASFLDEAAIDGGAGLTDSSETPFSLRRMRPSGGQAVQTPPGVEKPARANPTVETATPPPAVIDLPRQFAGDACREAWAEWIAHLREKDPGVTSRTLRMHLNAMAREPPERFVAGIRLAVAGGWKTLNPRYLVNHEESNENRNAASNQAGHRGGKGGGAFQPKPDPTVLTGPTRSGKL